MRIPRILRDNEIPFETIYHPPTFIAERRAERLGIPGSRLVKSVLLAANRQYSLAVLSSTHRISVEWLKSNCQKPIRLAGQDEIADVFRDCEYGVLTPFGSQYGIPTLMDEALAADGDIVFEAHFHALSLGMKCRDYERLEKPQRLPFAQL